jgi:uncharacterized protein (DUF2062 family)
MRQPSAWTRLDDMRDWIRQRMPNPESLQTRAGLRWLAPLLSRPGLWHFDRRRVALGAAIGVFCGLLIPIAQIAGAAVLALVLRGNVAVAALGTLVSNPVTLGPILVVAYRTGAAVLGEPVEEADSEALSASAEEMLEHGGLVEPSWMDRARAIGKPLFLGLGIFALVGSTLTWVLIQVIWTVTVRLKRKRRLAVRE